jgi:hypothetical protein
VISVTDGKTILRYQTRQTLFNIQPLRMRLCFAISVPDAIPHGSRPNHRETRRRVATALPLTEKSPHYLA